MKNKFASEECLCSLIGDEVFISNSQSLLLRIVWERYGMSPEKQVIGRIIEIKEEEIYLEFKFGFSLVKMMVPKERISLVMNPF